MIVVGNFEGNGHIPLHFDKDDYINAIVSIGDNNIKGGSTIYYSGESNKNFGTKQLSVPFKNGRVQIGFFDSVLHGAEEWKNVDR